MIIWRYKDLLISFAVKLSIVPKALHHHALYAVSITYVPFHCYGNKHCCWGWWQKNIESTNFFQTKRHKLTFISSQQQILYPSKADLPLESIYKWDASGKAGLIQSFKNCRFHPIKLIRCTLMKKIRMCQIECTDFFIRMRFLRTLRGLTCQKSMMRNQKRNQKSDFWYSIMWLLNKSFDNHLIT